MIVLEETIKEETIKGDHIRFDIPIGEKFKYKDNYYHLVKHDSLSCFYCIFKQDPIACSQVICCKCCRKDETHVIVVLAEKD